MERVLRFLDTLDSLAFALRLALQGRWGERLTAAGLAGLVGALAATVLIS